MSLTTFNIGLSLLSRNGNQKAEARRVLSLLEGRTVTDSDISKEEGGRPFIQVAGSREQVIGCEEQVKSIDFNISHSGDMVAVSHIRGEGLRTGCDIQIVKERVNTMQIAEQFFTPAENKYIITQKEQGSKTAFFKIWTLKECYLKLYGLSVFDMAPKKDAVPVPSFIDENGRLNLAIDGISFFLFKLNGNNEQQYILAAAVNGISLTPSLKWFSESILPCERIYS